MKTNQGIILVSLALLLLAGCTDNRGVIENPAFVAGNAGALEIDKIEISDTATVLHFSAFYGPGGWVAIDPNTFLADDKGLQYIVRSAEGIELGKKLYMPDSGGVSFVLNFPPVAINATYVDFSEGDFDGAFKIWGIQLNDKWKKPALPFGFKEAKVDQAAVLPPVKMEVGKARIEGKILAYRPGMPDEVSVYVAYPFTHPYANEIKLPVDKKGAFSGEIDVFSTHPALVFWTGNPVRCYLAAGEKTTLILNPFAAHQEESSSDWAYIGGYLAPLSKELAQLDKVFTINTHFDTYEEFFDIIQNKTPESVKALFLDEYKETVAGLDTLQASPAAKQVLRSEADLLYAVNILAIPIWLERSAQYNERKRDPQAKPQAPKAESQPVSEDFYNDIKDFPLLNDPTLFYFSDFGNYADQLRQGKVQPILSQALGTDQGPLFDAIRTAEAYASIEDFSPLDAAQLEQLPAAYRAFIQEKNNELLEKIKANESKTGYVFHDIKDLAPDAVFPSILAKYKGKPILIDFWATWCGPCRVANEELKPVKKELAAANTDLVYVFLAGENSPEGVWNNMITDLHGEHFRLTEAQWNYFGEHFNLRAVPTYFFIDRKGNIQAKETGYPGLEQMKQRIYKLIE